jgi:uncharacterized protein (TIGR00369 family)
VNKTEIENMGINQSIFAVICSIQEHSPIFQALGFKFMYLGEGTAGIKMYLEPKYSSYGGRLNGGIIAALADNVMGMAGLTLGQVARTVDMNLNYFAPVFEETELTAEGYVINAGHTLIVTEANLYNNEKKLVAKSRGTYIRDKKFNLMEEMF